MEDKSFYKKCQFNDTNASDELLIKSKSSKSSQICGAWLLAITLTSSFLFTIIAWRTDFFLKSVAGQMVLRPGTRLYDFWSVDPVTTTFSVYLFNYTNTEAFENGTDKKLRLEEIGPFSYKVTTVKENVIFNENGTVSFQDRKIYTFAPELSKGSLTDLIVTPNIPYMSTSNHFRDSNAFTRWMVEKAFSSVNPFTVQKVEKLLWGYEDSLFTIAATVYKYQEKEELPFERFGLFAGKNGTQPDVNTIFTGETDISKKGLISRFNGQVGLSHWSTPQCNSLEAYSSSALPPYMTPETIYMYSKEACRRIPLQYKYSAMVRGVNSYRFELPRDVYNQSNENECFCGHSCLPDGVLNISACAFGGPLLSSKPHFLHGSPDLREPFEGLQPDEDKHRMYASIEPNLGLVLEARTTAQVNVMVRNLRGMSLNPVYEDKLILPVTWVTVKMDELPSSMMWEARFIVAVFLVSQAMVYYGPVLLSAVCMVILVHRQCQMNKEQEERRKKSTDSSVIVDSFA